MPATGIGTGVGLSSSQSWSSYWTQLTPYFALPATGVQLVVGATTKIYGDSLIAVAQKNNLKVTYTCDIGTQTGNDFSITPVTGDIGNHSLTINFKNGSLNLTETITLSVSAKSTSGTLGVLMIGDSTLADRQETIGGTIEGILTSCVITWLGTQGTTRKNEGYGGYRFKDFCDGISQPSKFVKAGVLNVPAYFADNSIAIPEVVYMRLGLNDISNYTPAQILVYSDILVDAFLALNKSVRVIVALPTTTTSDPVKWAISEDPANHDNFTTLIHALQSALESHYAGGVYDARVNCSFEWIYLDRFNHYTNALHPLSPDGDADHSRGLTAYINKAIESPLNGVVGYWKLDETTGNYADSVGVNTGVPSSVTQNVTGKIGKACSVVFDDLVAHYVQMGAIPNLNLPVDVYSISLWAKRNTLTNNYGGLACLIGHSGGEGGIWVLEDGSIVIADIGLTASHLWSTIWTDKAAFHHIVMVVSAIGQFGIAELFFDGISKGKPVAARTYVLDKLIIGADGNKNASFNFSGIIDEVGLFNKVLTSEQIDNLYNAGAGKSYPF